MPDSRSTAVLLIQRHQAKWTQAHIAAAMGVSRKCVKTWIDRFDAEGEAGLHDRSSRPHRCPPAPATSRAGRAPAPRSNAADRTGSARNWVCRPGRVADPAPPRRAYLAELDPMTGQVIRSSKATAVRYEREQPGELVHMDVKKLGRIPDGGGWRAHGREHGPDGARRERRSATTTSTRSSMTTPGWPTPRSSRRERHHLRRRS